MVKDHQIEINLIQSYKMISIVIGLIIFMFTALFSIALWASNHKSGFAILLIILSIIVFALIPAIFINKIISVFGKKGIIRLNEDTFKLNIVNKKTFNIEKQYQYRYCDIKSFQMSESAYGGNSSYLKLLINNGKTIAYTFFDQINNEDNVSKNVEFFFKSYNKGKNANEKISILPMFSTTKLGKYGIFGFSIIIAIVILLQIIYKPQTIPFSFLTGLILYFKIKSQQKGDIAIYERFKND